MEKEIISGIYKIENSINGKVYVGSSKNIHKRWGQHKNLLNKGKHHSIKLQRAWLKYGEDNFEFSIIEECSVKKLLYLEQYYIDDYKCYFEGYNAKEKTMDIYTEEDYEKDKEIKEYCSLITETISNTETKFYFSERKTIKNILNNKQTLKWLDKEYYIYSKIFLFVDEFFKDYKDKTIHIQNNDKPDNSGFISISKESDCLSFDVLIDDICCVAQFKWFINDNSIVYKEIEKISKEKNFWRREKTNICTECNSMIGYIFTSNFEKVGYLSDEYFEKLHSLETRLFPVYIDRLNAIYGENKEFMLKLKDFILINKLPYMIKVKSKYLELKEIRPKNKDYGKHFIFEDHK